MSGRAIDAQSRASRGVALLLTALAFGCGSQAAPSSPPTSAGGATTTPQAGGANGGASAGFGAIASGGGGVGDAAGGVGAVGGMAAAGGVGASAGSVGAMGGTDGIGGAVSGAGGGSVGGSSGGTGNGGMGGQSQAVGTPKNPVLPGLNADPQIATFGGKFYIYPTTDGFANWMSTSFHAFSSTDLVTWTDNGVVLSLGQGGVSWATSQAWAPGIATKDGTYYFYFAAGMQIGVATSTSPTGPFKDALGQPLVTTSKYGVASIDPYAFTDDDGDSYLYFGSGSTGRVVKLNDDMISFNGTPTTITIGGFREGSVAFKRNGKYYFMYSVGDTRSATYNVAYGMGTSPMGPFTKAAVNPILQENAAQGILGTGHNSVLQLANGDWYIAYHRFAIPSPCAATDSECLGTHRQVCLDRMEFNTDGTIVAVKPTL